MDKYDPHNVSELVCLKCLYRWIAVYPSDTLLIGIECPKCHKEGYAINTGQEMQGDYVCHTCGLFENAKCKLNINPPEYDYCDYYKHYKEDKNDD